MMQQTDNWYQETEINNFNIFRYLNFNNRNYVWSICTSELYENSEKIHQAWKIK